MSAEPVNGLPGWWGKLPGAGDFSHRRLADTARTVVDAWLQTELAGLRVRHVGWQSAYLRAPLWHFALGVDVMTPAAWLGVLMPSVDRVGRYFPLLILQPADEVASCGRTACDWWRRAAGAALQALAEDHDSESLERALARWFSPADAVVAGRDETMLPGPGRSHWRSGAGAAAPLACDGWPRGAHFDWLFDLAGLPVSMDRSA